MSKSWGNYPKVNTSSKQFSLDEKAKIISEDGNEITRTPQWTYYGPSIKNGDAWEDTDVSSESSEIQALCAALWTDSVKTSYQTHQDSLENLDDDKTP